MGTSALTYEKNSLLSQLAALKAKTTKTAEDHKRIFDIAARLRAIDAEMAIQAAKPRVATDTDAGAGQVGTSMFATSSYRPSTAYATSGTVTKAVKGDEADSGWNWDAITGIVGTVAQSTKQILDQQAARKAERRAARLPVVEESGSSMPGGSLPWDKIAVGAVVGVVGIVLVKKLLG